MVKTRIKTTKGRPECCGQPMRHHPLREAYTCDACRRAVDEETWRLHGRLLAVTTEKDTP
jgi:hypothetical protein